MTGSASISVGSDAPNSISASYFSGAARAGERPGQKPSVPMATTPPRVLKRPRQPRPCGLTASEADSPPQHSSSPEVTPPERK